MQDARCTWRAEVCDLRALSIREIKCRRQAKYQMSYQSKIGLALNKEAKKKLGKTISKNRFIKIMTQCYFVELCC